MSEFVKAVRSSLGEGRVKPGCPIPPVTHFDHSLFMAWEKWRDSFEKNVIHGHEKLPDHCLSRIALDFRTTNPGRFKTVKIGVFANLKNF